MYKVLIIDDEAMIRKGLRESVPWTDIECEVVGVASNGYDGLQAIDQWEPDIVVTDIKMPGYDGIQVAEHAIQTNPWQKSSYLVDTASLNMHARRFSWVCFTLC